MISIRDLNLKLGEFSLINVNLEIKQGEYFVVLGPTGAGKTLIIESIAGLLRPDKGEVWIAGTNVTKTPASQRTPGSRLVSPKTHLRFSRNEMTAMTGTTSA